MDKAKKLIINLALIIICIILIYHFGGFYLSKEQCIKEQLRGMHTSLGEPATEIQVGNMIYTIYKDYKDAEQDGNAEGEIMVVVTQKIGFLYRAKSYQNSSGDVNNVTVSWFKTVDEKGYIIVAERIDDSIARADVTMMLDGSDMVTLTFDKWENNVGVIYQEGEQMFFATYQTYDESGNLIEDLWGDGLGIVQ